MNMENGKTIGEWLAPTLLEMEDTLWSYEIYMPSEPYGFSDDSFRAIIKLFMAAIMDKMWALQEGDEMEIEDRAAMAEKCGKDVRALVKTFTGIDTHNLYEK